MAGRLTSKNAARVYTKAFPSRGRVALAAAISVINEN